MYDEEIREGLESIPGAYMVKDIITKKSKTALKIIIKKLKKGKNAVYHLPEERAGNYNLLSFLFWSVGEKASAFEYNEKVTGSDKNNITAIANKTWFHLESQEYFKAKLSWDEILNLKHSQEFEAIILIGEAELAYYYTRLGFTHYEKAVTKFNVVLSKALYIPTINQSLVYLWKVELGLAYRRLSHFGNVVKEEQLKATKQRLKNAVEVFIEIIEADWDSTRNKAFAFVQLGIIEENIKWQCLKKQDFFPEKFLEWDAGRFYEKAKALYGKNTHPYLLVRYGNYLRHTKRFADAEEMLRSAIEIRPTSTAHHYLALTLKSKLNKEILSEQDEPFAKSFPTPAEGQKGETTKSSVYVKSPMKLLNLPKETEDDRTKEILHHLDQSLTLGENTAAIYDKGLILRAMGEFDRAIDVFKNIVEEETSLLYLANAYEQWGLCLQSITGNLCDDSDRKKDLLYSQKCYFMKSVAISTKMVSRISNISEAWVSGTTLKKIILGEGKSKTSLKELANLCEKLRNYKDAIGYYQEIINLDENGQNNPELLMKIAKNQIDDKNFVEAVSLFDLIRMISTGKECIDQKLYITALIEAGFDTVKMKTEPQLGADYLKTALNQILFLSENRMHPTNGTEDDHTGKTGSQYKEFDFDIFILCDKTDETMLGKAARLMNILENTFNLKVTLNENDIVGGVLELSAMLSVISLSKVIIICFDRPCSENVSLMRCIEHAVRNKSSIVTVIPDENIRISDNLKMFPWLVHKSFSDDDKENVEWMKKLFYKFSECWPK